MILGKKTWRRGRKAAAALSNPDHPYTMKLPDGRTIFVEVPGRWVTTDRSGQPAFLPEGVAFLDRVRALALSALDSSPGPAYITTLREALSCTQQEFGARIGVDKMTVSRWERGTLKPSEESLKAIEELRHKAVRKGVVLPS